MSDSNNLMVVDNFYPEPEYIRKMALQSDYQPTIQSKFMCHCARVDDAVVALGLDLITRIIGESWRQYFRESYFVWGTKEDEKTTRGNKRWVHYDKESLIGIVYLNPPEQCFGGTGFYRHKKTRLTHYDEIKAYCADHNLDIEEFMDEGVIPEAWETVTTVEMKFNRLTLFDPKQLHQSTSHFGDSVSNARLFQQYVFDRATDAS